jgi:hypothetical protein
MNFVILNQRWDRKKWHIGSRFDCVIDCWRVPSLAMVSKLNATLVQTKGKSLLNGLTGSISCHTDWSSREWHYPEVGATRDYLCTASSSSLFNVVSGLLYLWTLLLFHFCCYCTRCKWFVKSIQKTGIWSI